MSQGNFLVLFCWSSSYHFLLSLFSCLYLDIGPFRLILLLLLFFSSIFHVFWEIFSTSFSRSSVFYLTFNFFYSIFTSKRDFCSWALRFLRFPSSCALDILQVTFFNLLAPIFALEALLKCLVIPTFKGPIGNFMYLGGSCLLWASSRVVWLTSSLGGSLGQYFSFWSHSGEKVSSADVLGLGWGCGWQRSQRLAWRLSFKLTVGCEFTVFSCACIPHRRGLFFVFVF